MTQWVEFVDEAPELAAAVAARLTASKHHVLATQRSDGRPRVSGTEVDFFGGDLVCGSMPGAVKANDLQRNGAYALHANPGDGSMDGGDAKVAGAAVEITDQDVKQQYVTQAAAEGHPPGPFHLFRLGLSEAVLTSVIDGQLVIQLWRPGSGVRRFART